MMAKMIFRAIKHSLTYFRPGFSPGYGITLADQCYLARWPNMVKEMKTGDFSTSENLIEFEEKWDGSKGPTITYAMIDDIGQTEDMQKAYLVGALGRIADMRLGTWTIWTANLSLEQIGDQLDRRISSRMLRDGNVVVELPADFPDYNLR